MGPMKYNVTVDVRCPICGTEVKAEAAQAALKQQPGTLKCEHCGRVNRFLMFLKVVGLLPA